MWRKLKKHKMALAGLICFGLILFFVLFAEFNAPYTADQTTKYRSLPPQIPHFVDKKGNFSLRPFVYEYNIELNFETGEQELVVDKTKKYYIQFFVKGPVYQFLFFKSDIHLFGVDDGEFFLLGTDRLGRDQFSRLLYGGRTSLFIASLTGIITLFVGTAVGLVSGYFGGWIDVFIQRIVELFLIIPDIPLGLALAAFLPPDLSPAIIIIGITLVLTIMRWATVTRQVRGKALALKENEFILAARSFGSSRIYIMIRHVFPHMLTHLIVLFTLIFPQTIIAESGLSFLGFGVKPPMVSWGLLLREAQHVRVISLYPWRLLPGIAIMITVLSLNFIGDGVRDAADPYSD